MKKYFNEFIETTGNISILIVRVFKSFRSIPKYRKLIFYYMYEVTGSSLFVLLFAALFIGMVSAYQIAYQLRNYLPFIFVSTLVTQTVLLEIGPLLTGIAFSGKVSSSIAAELASMKVTDQIDALEVMSVDPVEYLIMPRVVATLIMIPFLTLIAEFMIVLGAYLIAILGLNVTSSVFLEGARKNFQMYQIYSGLIKVIFFGFFTIILACYFGLSAKMGSKSVGKATTQAVIVTSVVIVVLDYILTRLLFLW